MARTSRARSKIKKWFTANDKGVRPPRAPFYVAEGHVVIYPSKSGKYTHHVTSRTERLTRKNHVIVEWVCSCPGWFNSDIDNCWHVEDLKSQYTMAKQKMLQKEQAS